jgi:hypothetical protein
MFATALTESQLMTSKHDSAQLVTLPRKQTSKLDFPPILSVGFNQRHSRRLEAAARACSVLSELQDDVLDFDVIGIDEGQFVRHFRLSRQCHACRWCFVGAKQCLVFWCFLFVILTPIKSLVCFNEVPGLGTFL